MASRGRLFLGVALVSFEVDQPYREASVFPKRRLAAYVPEAQSEPAFGEIPFPADRLSTGRSAPVVHPQTWGRFSPGLSRGFSIEVLRVQTFPQASKAAAFVVYVVNVVLFHP